MEVAITCECKSLSFFGETNYFAIQSKTNPIFFKNNLINLSTRLPLRNDAQETNFYFLILSKSLFQIRTRMSRVLSEITMDDIKTVRETANAVSKLATIPDECEVEAQVL